LLSLSLGGLLRAALRVRVGEDFHVTPSGPVGEDASIVPETGHLRADGVVSR
jgi:hypothetical protein